MAPALSSTMYLCRKNTRRTQWCPQWASYSVHAGYKATFCRLLIFAPYWTSSSKVVIARKVEIQLVVLHPCLVMYDSQVQLFWVQGLMYKEGDIHVAQLFRVLPSCQCWYIDSSGWEFLIPLLSCGHWLGKSLRMSYAPKWVGHEYFVHCFTGLTWHSVLPETAH